MQGSLKTVIDMFMLISLLFTASIAHGGENPLQVSILAGGQNEHGIVGMSFNTMNRVFVNALMNTDSQITSELGVRLFFLVPTLSLDRVISEELILDNVNIGTGLDAGVPIFGQLQNDKKHILRMAGIGGGFRYVFLSDAQEEKVNSSYTIRWHTKFFYTENTPLGEFTLGVLVETPDFIELHADDARQRILLSIGLRWSYGYIFAGMKAGPTIWGPRLDNEEVREFNWTLMMGAQF